MQNNDGNNIVRNVILVDSEPVFVEVTVREILIGDHLVIVEEPSITSEDQKEIQEAPTETHSNHFLRDTGMSFLHVSLTSLHTNVKFILIKI
jgi:hypothetical protein